MGKGRRYACLTAMVGQQAFLLLVKSQEDPVERIPGDCTIRGPGYTGRKG